MKILDAYKIAPSSGRCDSPVETLGECESAIKALQIPATVVNESVVTAAGGCSATVDAAGQWTATFNVAAKAAACPASTPGAALSGSAEVGTVSVAMQVDAAKGSVELTMSCASGGFWFGVGLNATKMDGSYAVVVDGTGAVTEHSLGMHAPGTQLPPTVTVVSNKVCFLRLVVACLLVRA